MFILQDGIFYLSHLMIRNYVNGLVIKINYQDSLKDLLCYLKNHEVKKKLSQNFLI